MLNSKPPAGQAMVSAEITRVRVAKPKRAPSEASAALTSSLSRIKSATITGRATIELTRMSESDIIIEAAIAIPPNIPASTKPLMCRSINKRCATRKRAKTDGMRKASAIW
ncbi:MAG: hypothetical protein CO091_02450 [Candidatus Aquicultor secundus]|nr:MAG: hypothetical protein CO091_02450 [Candidatus Aquicultor secundus]